MTGSKVICDSQYKDTRLITLEIELHRFILPEFNTHRQFSRNFQSSRAVPVKKIIQQVRENPAIPVHWGKNQKGMVAEQENEAPVIHDWDWDGVDYPMNPEAAWRYAASNAADIAHAFNEAGYHKQIVNRLLEPFMWTKGVVTATSESYGNFFALRLHKDAQPEIKALAEAMYQSIGESQPRALQAGEWHLPYVGPELDHLPLLDRIKVSTSCCAQVSYRSIDTSVEKALRIYNSLNLPRPGEFSSDPPHFSPSEHIALADPSGSLENSGNFATPNFHQYRKMLEAQQRANKSDLWVNTQNQTRGTITT